MIDWNALRYPYSDTRYRPWLALNALVPPDRMYDVQPIPWQPGLEQSPLSDLFSTVAPTMTYQQAMDMALRQVQRRHEQRARGQQDADVIAGAILARGGQ